MRCKVCRCGIKQRKLYGGIETNGTPGFPLSADIRPARKNTEAAAGDIKQNVAAKIPQRGMRTVC